MSLADQVCQIAHAAHEAGIHLSNETEQISSIVVCSIPNEKELLKAMDRIEAHGVRVVLFREPDLNGEATALATEPIPSSERRKLCKYPLWKRS